MNRDLLHIAFTSMLTVALIAPLSAQQSRGGAMARPLERRQALTADESGPRPQAFSVSLVLGEMQASSASDTVPAAARKALADLKDFLPYKGYRLLDTQWTLCCGGSPILTRLRGPEEQDYSLELMPRNAGSGKYSVHFSLWEPRSSETTVQGAGASGRSGSMASVEAQHAQLEQQLAEMRRTLGENHPDVAQTKNKIESLERSLNDVRATEAMRRTFVAAAGSRRAIIDTSFTMDVGETVVVGTSRLKGDKALIAVLTAVAPAKSSTK